MFHKARLDVPRDVKNPIKYHGANECGGRPLLREHEVAVQTTNQPGKFTPAWHVQLWSDNCSPFS